MQPFLRGGGGGELLTKGRKEGMDGLHGPCVCVVFSALSMCFQGSSCVLTAWVHGNPVSHTD